jgi:hypothetical protein
MSIIHERDRLIDPWLDHRRTNVGVECNVRRARRNFEPAGHLRHSICSNVLVCHEAAACPQHVADWSLLGNTLGNITLAVVVPRPFPDSGMCN